MTTVLATDRRPAAVTYSIAGGADAALFAINAATGALSFVAAPDFEAPADAGGDNVYDVVVSASDGSLPTPRRSRSPWATSTRRPRSSRTAAVTRRRSRSTRIAAGSIPLLASDPDGDRPLTASPAAPTRRCSPSTRSRARSASSPPDFEAPGDADGDNVYEVVVGASDGSLRHPGDRVTVGNVNEGLVISTRRLRRRSRSRRTEPRPARSAAGDADGAAIHYSIAGGADAAASPSIRATGALSFARAPNFEAPGDAGGDNVYDVVVSADDGTARSAQAVSVTVGNVNEGVTIVSNGGGDLGLGLGRRERRRASTRSRRSTPTATRSPIRSPAAPTRPVHDQCDHRRAELRRGAQLRGAGRRRRQQCLRRRQVAASAGAFSDTQALAVTVANVNEPVITSNGGGATASISVAENNQRRDHRRRRRSRRRAGHLFDRLGRRRRALHDQCADRRCSASSPRPTSKRRPTPVATMSMRVIVRATDGSIRTPRRSRDRHQRSRRQHVIGTTASETINGTSAPSRRTDRARGHDLCARGQRHRPGPGRRRLHLRRGRATTCSPAAPARTG